MSVKIYNPYITRSKEINSSYRKRINEIASNMSRENRTKSNKDALSRVNEAYLKFSKSV